MSNKNPNNKFSKDNQPLNRGRSNGKKLGSKLISEYVFEHQDYIKVPLSKIVTYFGDVDDTRKRQNFYCESTYAPVLLNEHALVILNVG